MTEGEGVVVSSIPRRAFLAVLGGASALSLLRPLAARAQQTGAVRVVGILMGIAASDPAGQSELAAFRDALAKLGWMEGSNLRIELRWGGGDPQRIAAMAKELVALRPDAILGRNSAVIGALARETQTIPIVFTVVIDPIGSSFVASLNRPGANITGFTAVDAAMGGKWMELLKEIAPLTARVALLSNPATASPAQFLMPSIQTAAQSLAVQASVASVHVKDEIEGVIAAQSRQPGSSLIAMPDPFNVVNRELIIELAARYRVPAIYFDRFFAKSGGLIAYGSDLVESFRQAAGYIDRILNGAKPADLPVQAPTKFELTINLKTAKALGLIVPQSLLVAADEVIE